MTDKPLTEAELEQRRAAGFQPEHGLRSAFAEGRVDETALTTGQRSRLAELRAELATPGGVQDALRERAARMLLIVEWGETWLRDKAEAAGAVAAFESPVLARFFTAVAETRRILESLHKIQGKPDGLGADDVLRELRQRGKRE